VADTTYILFFGRFGSLRVNGTDQNEKWLRYKHASFRHGHFPKIKIIDPACKPLQNEQKPN